jgi:hypothetical protein
MGERQHDRNNAMLFPVWYGDNLDFGVFIITSFDTRKWELF